MKSDREKMLELMRDSAKQQKYYLRFPGGADLLARDVYQHVLEPMKNWSW